MKFLIPSLLLLAGASAVHSAQVATLTFNNPTDLSNNFRQLQAPGATGTVTVTTDTTPNSYVNVRAGTTNPAYVSVYDTTPANGADANPTFSGAFTLSLSVSSANSTGSFGVYLFDNADTANNLLAIYNIDTNNVATGNEQIRFFRDSTIATGGASNQYATTAFTGTGGTSDATSNSYLTTAANRGAVTIDTVDPFTFYQLTFAYDPTALTLKVSAPGGFSSTLAIPAGDVIANPAIGLRVNDPDTGNDNSLKFDNFGIVPEPSSALMVLGASALLVLRRKR